VTEEPPDKNGHGPKVAQAAVKGSTRVRRKPIRVASVGRTTGGQHGQGAQRTSRNDESTANGDARAGERDPPGKGAASDGSGGRQGENERRSGATGAEDHGRAGAAHTGEQSSSELAAERPEVAGEVAQFSVDPARFAALRSFRCGPGGCRAEVEVNRMVRDYTRRSRKADTFRVTVEQPAKVIGVAAFQAAAFPQPALQQINGYPYIAVIGLSEAYRGMVMGGERMGMHVLRDILAAIDGFGRWGTGPDVFALVDPRNKPSCDLFEWGGFQVLASPHPEDTESDALYWRPEHR
jgi:hypothetical protein